MSETVRRAGKEKRSVEPERPEDALPHMPVSLCGGDFDTPEMRARFSWAEHWLCLLDRAPERCTQRACRASGLCTLEAESGHLFAQCKGRPGIHVRHWIIGFWLAEMIADTQAAFADGRAPR